MVKKEMTNGRSIRKFCLYQYLECDQVREMLKGQLTNSGQRLLAYLIKSYVTAIAVIGSQIRGQHVHPSHWPDRHRGVANNVRVSSDSSTEIRVARLKVFCLQ